MRENVKPENTEEKENKNHPSNSFLWPGLLYCSTGGGIGVVSLTWSLEIFGTNISMDDDESTVLEIRAEGRKNKNASYSELGDENASGSELQGLHLQGV